MAWQTWGWYIAPPLAHSRALAGLLTVLLLWGSPLAALGLEPPAPAISGAAALPEPQPTPELQEEVLALRDDLGALWLQLDRLTDGADAPRWATEEHDRLDRRLERLTTMLERLSARAETPVPRLDEPLTLLTVALATLVLGFVAGRSLQRRTSRKDSRFRL